MRFKSFVMSGALLSLVAATPIVNEARGPSPVEAAPAATVSVTPSTIQYTAYFASTHCEFTSSTQIMKNGQCISVGTEFGSFSFSGFQNGNDHSAGTICQLQIFSAANCSGTSISSIAASSASISDTCSAANSGSALLSC